MPPPLQRSVRSDLDELPSAAPAPAHAHWQVSQPFASFSTPLGHAGRQPRAGQVVPVTGGGAQPLPAPSQLQLHGGQL